jgi:hypothetical protein
MHAQQVRAEYDTRQNTRKNKKFEPNITKHCRADEFQERGKEPVDDELQVCYTVVTLLLHCCYTVVALLLHCCCTVVTLLLHCCYTVV